MAAGVKVERTRRWWRVVLVAAGVLFGCLIQPSSSCGGWDNPIPIHDPAGLYPPYFKDERAALLGIKAGLNDPTTFSMAGPSTATSAPATGRAWSVIPMTTSTSPTYMYPAEGLSGYLSPRIGDLTSLHKLVLQGNAISGPIPDAIGRLELLTELDVSNNSLNRSIPSSLGDLNLFHMKLNNNNLSGSVPDSFGALEATLDLSFNNLSGPLPNLSPGALDVTGNPLICGVDSGDTCSHNQKTWPHHGTALRRRVLIICAVAVGSVIPVRILLWWRYPCNKKVIPVPVSI